MAGRREGGRQHGRCGQRSAQSRSPEEERTSTPWRDAWRLFRRNRAAVVALGVIVAIFSLAISAPLLTHIGLLDRAPVTPRATSSTPPTCRRSTCFPTPGTCARDGQDQNPYWCGWLSDDVGPMSRTNTATGPRRTPNARQWCYLLGGDSSGRDWLTQTVYGGQVSLAVGVLGATMSLIVGLIYGWSPGTTGPHRQRHDADIDFMYGALPWCW